jgi:membrane protein YqaA with SNARE-associated domain
MSQSKNSELKINLFLLIFLLIVIIIAVLCILYPDFGEVFNIGNWFDADALGNVNYLLAFGFTMLVCFLGALVPVPIPYPLPITLFSSAWISLLGFSAWGLIILLVAFGTLANTMGDMVDYTIGRGAETVMKEDKEENRWHKLILNYDRAIPGIIVLFGLTPLPDSTLMVPLGVANYDMKKTLLWMYVGRFFMMFIYALGGVFALDWLIELTSSEGGWVFGVVTLFLMWGIIFFMLKFKPKIKE